MVWQANVKSVSVTSVTGSIRTVGGTYIGGAINTDLTQYIHAASPAKAQGLLIIHLRATESFGVTNNTPALFLGKLMKLLFNNYYIFYGGV